MEKIELGESGIYVNPVGLGCMGFSHASGDPMEKEEAVKRIREAYDLGYDFFDTAQCYTGIYPDGRVSYNEELVGEALKDVRDKVVIATKFGVQHNPDRSLKLDSSPETIRKSVEESLEKLQTNYIDLYYQHRIDPNTEPEEVARVMKELMEEGKIKAWGISEANEEYLRRAHAVCPVSAIENRYSMAARWHENLMPVCKELAIQYIAFSPMANGLLTGQYTSSTKFEGKQDYRTNMPQFSEAGYAKASPLLEYLDQLAKEKNCTMAQLSLTWMIHKDPQVIPIPGSRKISRMEENLHAADVKLTPEEIAKIDDILDGMEFDVFGGH